jgi:hypothetical protein
MRYLSLFNILIDDNIIKVSFDGKFILEANYLYKNVRVQNEDILYEKVYYDDKAITNDDLLQTANLIIKKYISDNPDYRDN